MLMLLVAVMMLLLAPTVTVVLGVSVSGGVPSRMMSVLLVSTHRDEDASLDSEKGIPK